jgi:hypothetical protein
MLRRAACAFAPVFDAASARSRASWSGMAVRCFQGEDVDRRPSARPTRGQFRQESFLAFKTCRPLYMPVFKSR